MTLAEAVGRYYLFKFRRRLEETDVTTVALQLKKQGIPAAVARLIVLGIRRRPEPPVLVDAIEVFPPPERASTRRD